MQRCKRSRSAGGHRWGQVPWRAQLAKTRHGSATGAGRLVTEASSCRELVRVVPWLIGVAVWSAAAPAQAQSNLDAGKSPAQIFSNTCNACHRSPRELKQTSAGFLTRALYDRRREAAAMAAYLASVGSDPRAVQQRRPPTLGPASGSGRGSDPASAGDHRQDTEQASRRLPRLQRAADAGRKAASPLGQRRGAAGCRSPPRRRAARATALSAYRRATSAPAPRPQLDGASSRNRLPIQPLFRRAQPLPVPSAAASRACGAPRPLPARRTLPPRLRLPRRPPRLRRGRR